MEFYLTQRRQCIAGVPPVVQLPSRSRRRESAKKVILFERNLVLVSAAEIQQLLEQGEQQTKQGEYQKAIATYQKALDYFKVYGDELPNPRTTPKGIRLFKSGFVDLSGIWVF
jgi:hypothetical protein